MTRSWRGWGTRLPCPRSSTCVPQWWCWLGSAGWAQHAAVTRRSDMPWGRACRGCTMAAVPPWARAASAMSAAPPRSVLEGATIGAPSSTDRSTSTPLARPALAAIEACHSVAGEENYILKVRVATPTDLEDLLQQIRAAAGVSTRTTIVLSTPYENRPPDL